VESNATLSFVPTIILATDADRVYNEVAAAVNENHTLLRVHAGSDVAPAVAEYNPLLVILDLQIGNMGGIATCLDLRLEQRAGRLPTQPIIMLLDRVADIWLAEQAEIEKWLVKPIDPLEMSRTITDLLVPKNL